MKRKKEADLAGPAKLNEAEVSYPKPVGRSSHLPKFSDAVKRRWKIRRDDNGDEYVVLNGQNSLAKHGLDHAYMISGVRVGVWLTSRQIAAKIRRLQKKVAGVRIEMFGDGEAVVSVGIEQIDDLCQAVKARARRKVSDKELQRLQRISLLARRQKTLTKSTVRAPKRSKHGRRA